MNALQWLSGKKTYGTVAIGVLYLIGAKLGWYELDPKFLTGLGLAGLTFLRSGIGAEVSKLMDAAALHRSGVQKMREDPFYFVETEGEHF